MLGDIEVKIPKLQVLRVHDLSGVRTEPVGLLSWTSASVGGEVVECLKTGRRDAAISGSSQPGVVTTRASVYKRALIDRKVCQITRVVGPTQVVHDVYEGREIIGALLRHSPILAEHCQAFDSP